MNKLTPFTQNLLIALAAFFIFFFGMFSYHHSSSPDNNMYQAVFLDNGSSFYGKLENIQTHYPVLKNVYYLRANTPSIDPNTGTQVAPANPYNLVKFGEEIHSPEDSLQINKGHILYWVNIKDTGNVAQAIKKYTLESQLNPSEEKGVGIKEKGTL
jgi:hypothetical protein